MPFMHEENGGGGGNGNSPTPISLADLKNVIGLGNSSRVQRILPRESSSQHQQPQRKLQMGKILSNGSPSSTAAALAVAAMNNFQSPQSAGDRDASYVSSRRARSNNFTLKETFDLLKVWASPEMQWQMKHNFRNFRVWEAISYSMSELGHERTAIQCKNRIQNLTSIFYRIKKSKQDFRAFNFPYYKLIGDVLDGKKQGSSLGSLGLHAPSVNAYGQGLNPADFQNTNQNSPPSSSTAGFAAHLALVEEYQHLINGQPEGGYQPPANNSPQSNDQLNVLSPEVSLSEGNSPIRVENQGGSGSGLRNGSNHHQKDDDERLDEEEGGSEFDEQMQEDDEGCDNTESFGMGGRSGTKRSLPPSYSRGFPAKRPRGVSGASDGSFGSDPVAHYLSEMVEIERQWLDMERERAENERHMMLYMMQILQALVSPNQGQDDESDDGEERVGNEGQQQQGQTGDNKNKGDEEELKGEDEDEDDPVEKVEQNGDRSD